jgi:hypothetical protein
MENLTGTKSLYTFSAEMAYNLMLDKRLTEEAEKFLNDFVINRKLDDTLEELPIDFEREWQGIKTDSIWISIWILKREGKMNGKMNGRVLAIDICCGYAYWK